MDQLSSDDTAIKFKNVFPYAIWNKKKENSLYELAINNYISEIPRFFLKNKGLTTFKSKASKEILPAVSGTLYTMDINLYKEDNFDLIVSPFNDSKGRYFGPPTEMRKQVGTVTPHLVDPAYAPYVPSYFYGQTTLRIKYLADKSNPTIKEIISKLAYEEINTELDDLLANNGGTKDSTAYINKMPISASIIFDKTVIEPGVSFTENNSSRQLTDNINEAEQNRKWIISTKWECPALNFADNTPIYPEYSLTGTAYNRLIKGNEIGIAEAKPAAGIGIWSGYSTNYQSGIKISISTPDKTSAKTGSLADLCGFEAVEKSVGQLADTKDIYEAIVLIPYYDKTDERDTNEKFEYEKNDTERFEFIDLDREYVKISYEYLKAITDERQPVSSIVDMLKKMEKYEFPPHLDFLSKAKRNNFTDYNPFAMYIFEFSRTLNQKDLADIWQGVLPDVGITAQKDSVSIEHFIGEGELIKEIKDPKHLKWLIFKVKQKAEKFYNDLTEYDDERFKLLKTELEAENYGYNWPYDFCSLVELANVNVKFTLLNDEFYDIQIPKIEKPIPVINVTPKKELVSTLNIFKPPSESPFDKILNSTRGFKIENEQITFNDILTNNLFTDQVTDNINNQLTYNNISTETFVNPLVSQLSQQINVFNDFQPTNTVLINSNAIQQFNSNNFTQQSLNIQTFDKKEEYLVQTNIRNLFDF